MTDSYRVGHSEMDLPSLFLWESLYIESRQICITHLRAMIELGKKRLHGLIDLPRISETMKQGLRAVASIVRETYTRM